MTRLDQDEDILMDDVLGGLDGPSWPDPQVIPPLIHLSPRRLKTVQERRLRKLKNELRFQTNVCDAALRLNAYISPSTQANNGLHHIVTQMREVSM